jgi:hypothetical protein
VTLEQWDYRSKRWILYATQADHSADCAKHPFEQIPQRVFLDTNIVNLIVKWPEQIFEQAAPPPDLDEGRAHDIEALMHLFYIGQRMSWQMIASAKTLEEIDRTVDEAVRNDLLNYAIEVADTSVASRWGRELGRRLNGSTLLQALPDASDRELLGNAIGMGCDVFCTRDHKTIIRKRDQLPLLPLRILTPTEWWAAVKPWGGLWC